MKLIQKNNKNNKLQQSVTDVKTQKETYFIAVLES